MLADHDSARQEYSAKEGQEGQVQPIQFEGRGGIPDCAN